MKKLFVTTLVAFALFAGSLAYTANASAAAPAGLYNIDEGKQQYHSILDFKKMNVAEKKQLFRANYHILAGPSIYPIMSLLLAENEIEKTGVMVADFEQKNNVKLDEIANKPTAKTFEVTNIE